MNEIQPNTVASRPLRKRKTHTSEHQTRLTNRSMNKQERLKNHFIEHPDRMVGTMVRYIPYVKGSRREEEILGCVVGTRIESSSNGNVIAYQKVYVVDENRVEDPASATRVISLENETKSWTPVPLNEWKGRKGMVGRRIICLWEAEYVTRKNKALQEKMNSIKIPYEAFIVRVLGKGRYKLLYTAEDSYYEANLANSSDWAFVEDTQTHYEELPIVSWSTAGREVGESDVLCA